MGIHIGMTILKTTRQHWVSETFWTKEKGGEGKYFTSEVRMGEEEGNIQGKQIILGRQL